MEESENASPREHQHQSETGSSTAGSEAARTAEIVFREGSWEPVPDSENTREQRQLVLP